MSLRSVFRNIHDSSPVPLQTTIRMLYGRLPARWKLGGEFRAYSKELARNEWLPREDLKAMQLEKLQALVLHAYQSVPFYQRLFDGVGFKPEHLKRLEDIRNIPTIGKAELREHFGDLRAANASQYQPEECTTGGSTGEPVRFLLDRKAIVLEKACLRRHWLRSGYRDGEPCANLRGLRIATKPGAYWVTDAGENCLYLSSYHLTSETVGGYVRAFNEFAPTLLNTYASNGAFFAKLITESKLESVSPRSIVTSSETLYPFQREWMEELFKAKVWDWYGLTELVGNASECELHNGYHISMEQGYFEALCKDDRPAEEGEIGEIVATGLHNFSMPLIRYRTGDMAEFTNESCPCGRGLDLVRQIKGRALEYIETPSGARMTVTALNVHGGTWRNVRQFQYVQKAPDRVLLRVIKGDQYSEADEKRILAQMGERFGDEIKVGMEYVREIPKTIRGKTPLVVKETDDQGASD